MKKICGLLLKSNWEDDGSQTGRLRLRLVGDAGTRYPEGLRLAYTAITRIPPGTEPIGARFVTRTANYHELATPGPLNAGTDGLLWECVIPSLSHRPQHCTDGPKSAFLIRPDGSTVPVRCAPLLPKSSLSRSNDAPPDVVEDVEQTENLPLLGLLPNANCVRIESWAEEAPLCFSVEQHNETVEAVSSLYERLFAPAAGPYRCDNKGPKITIQAAGPALKKRGSAAFALHFEKDTIAVEGVSEGLFYGLVALAQIWHAARVDGEGFSFPQSGVIEDSPLHEWRGMHLDVSRQFYSKQAVTDFLDVLAWHRFNRFHWHLTDDEGWRLESPAYPQLTRIGAWRGHKQPLLPQHGSGSETYGGFYSQEDVRAVLEHALLLNIDVVPELDVPGHSQSALVSVPELLDPSAMQGGASVQGYVNNALNPGLNATWTFLETVFGEVCDLFPSHYVHMGGDEVADAAWAGSRSAKSWAQAKGYVDANGRLNTMQMQAAVLRFVEDHLSKSGKTPMAWEEAAKGGGLDPEKTIMMAWVRAQSGPDLAAQGYRVVMCPGEAYYLDMAQSKDWMEPGLSWAGTSSPKQTYQFDPTTGLEKSPKLLGIQGCIWSENIVSRDLFNHMTFPRLSAIAESAWGLPDQKNWDSFKRRVALMPKMPPETV